MKTFRDTFEENFMAVDVPANNKKGFKIRYEYYGPWYMWALPADAMRRMKIIIAALCAAGIASFFLSALQDTAMNYRNVVSLPGMLSIAALLFEVIGVVQFLLTKEKVTRPAFHDIDRKMKITPLLHALLLLATVVACVYVWCSEKMTFSQASVVFGYFCAALCSALIFCLYRRIDFKTEKNEISKSDASQGRNML